MMRLVSWLVWVAGAVGPVTAQAPASPLTEFPSMHVEYLGQTQLLKSEKDAIAAFVFGDINLADCVDPGRLPQQEWTYIRIAHAKLTTTPERYLLVQASDGCQCSPTGNCAFWVLRKRAKGFDALLATDMVQTFSLTSHRTHGLLDLKTSSHGSATQHGLVLYQFDGEQYRSAECAVSEHELDEHGNPAKKQTITKVDCT